MRPWTILHNHQFFFDDDLALKVLRRGRAPSVVIDAVDCRGQMRQYEGLDLSSTGVWPAFMCAIKSSNLIGRPLAISLRIKVSSAGIYIASRTRTSAPLAIFTTASDAAVSPENAIERSLKSNR